MAVITLEKAMIEQLNTYFYAANKATDASNKYQYQARATGICNGLRLAGYTIIIADAEGNELVNFNESTMFDTISAVKITGPNVGASRVVFHGSPG